MLTIIKKDILCSHCTCRSKYVMRLLLLSFISSLVVATLFKHIVIVSKGDHSSITIVLAIAIRNLMTYVRTVRATQRTHHQQLIE